MQTKLAFKVAGITVTLFTVILPLGNVAQAQDRGECEMFARDYARRASRRGGGLITGAARGGIRTGIVGGIFGDRKSNTRCLKNLSISKFGVRSTGKNTLCSAIAVLIKISKV